MKSITFLALLLAPVSAVAISFSGDKAAASHQIQLKLGNDICSAVAVRANCVLTVGHCAGGGTAWRQAYTDPSGAANPVPNSIVGNISQSEVIHMGPVDGVVVMRIHRNIVGAGDVAQIAGSPLPNGSSVTVNGNGLNEYGRAHVSNASFRDSLDFINTPGGGPFYSVKSTQQGGRYMEIKGGDSGAGAFAGGKLQGVICTSGTSAGQPAASIIDISRNKAEVEATIKRVCEDPLPGGNPITCSITVQQTTVNQGGDINFTLSGTGPIAYATVTKPTASGAPDVIRIDPYRGAYQGSV